MVKMWGYPLESLRHLFAFKRYSTSALYRHFEFPTSTDVGPCWPMSTLADSDTGRSGTAENVGVAVEIASLERKRQTLLNVIVAFGSNGRHLGFPVE
jgi:hypothetical protein